ncbi:MAG: hypothetical protein A3G76_04725 [Acidobacteria bacterium RIFCSPLOWO2_12_FULL_65_11]|nr:MAG: hypothetical protein A3G76_04725 [Acidobacteria bacterium RIFCSPLOWO2_12_FULL_65_11]
MATCPTCGASYTSTTRICTQDGTVLPVEAATQDPQAGRVLDGKYRLESFLSHGGMGSVYRATHIMLDKTVAVKLIKPDLVTSPDIVARFQREARAASNLSHPNIVSVYDLGQADDGTLYIAMELIDGPSLKDVIRKRGPMGAARIVRILSEVASALALAHKHNIIHRDLKPQNIMLATDTEHREVAKLLDFGIAKTFDDSATQLTRTGFALGTPQYMAPEQAAGTDVDGRTDLYSLGAILYEMLTGEVPFTDPSTPALLIKLMTEVPEPPSRRKPDVALSPALEAMALRCLEKDPAKRFESAEALGEALGRVDTGMDRASVARGSTLTVPMATPTAPRATSGVSSTAPTIPTAGRTVLPASVESPGARTPRGGAIWLAVATAAVLLLIGVGALRLGRGPSPAGTATSDTGAAAPPPASTEPATPAPPTTGNAQATESGPTGSGADIATSGGAPATPAEGPPAEQVSQGSQGSPTPDVQARASRPPAPATTADTPARGQAAPAAASPSLAQGVAQAAFPENPPVFFQCAGAIEVCAAVRSSLDRALERNNLPAVRNADRAAIVVTATATVLQDRVSQNFGTTLATRTYSVDLTGETKEGDVVAMPPARTFSFDAQFGRARLDENAGLIADGVVESVRAFSKKRRQ